MYNSYFNNNKSLSQLTDPYIVKSICKFIKENPFPVDDKVHDFADTLGIEHDLLEMYIYAILTVLISGGLTGSPEIEVDLDNEQGLKGIGVEYEHVNMENFTDNPVVEKICYVLASKIASDHIYEDSEYYDKLEKMEK